MISNCTEIIWNFVVLLLGTFKLSASLGSIHSLIQTTTKPLSLWNVNSYVVEARKLNEALA